jgi:hypothetical protein
MAAKRFTIFDAMVLMCATSIGFWLARLRLLIDADMPLGPGQEAWMPWCGASYLVLLAITMGFAGISLLPPRPPLRRLARQPGFLTGLAVAANLVLWTALNAVDWLFPRGQIPMSPGYYLIRFRVYLLSIGGPWNVGFAVALAWTIGGIQGLRWSRADWVERAGRWMGVAWLLYWSVFLGLVRWEQ